MDTRAYVVNVDGVVLRDGEYLLIERGGDEPHAGGTLAFPGGTVEGPPDGEDAIAATARRELYEEVGVEIGSVEYVLSSTFDADDGTPCLNVLTLCEHESGEAFPRAPEEVAAVYWLRAEELGERDPPAFLRRDVRRIEEYRRATRDG